MANELQVDLIIISTHGRTGLSHVLLGSTAERVIRHASCPVLVVREKNINSSRLVSKTLASMPLEARMADN